MLVGVRAIGWGLLFGLVAGLGFLSGFAIGLGSLMAFPTVWVAGVLAVAWVTGVAADLFSGLSPLFVALQYLVVHDKHVPGPS